MIIFFNITVSKDAIDWIEPRLNQIVNPLLSLIKINSVKEEVLKNIKNKQEEILEDRKNSVLWVILEIIYKKFKKDNDVYIKYILDQLSIIEWRNNFTARKLGSLLKQNWLKTYRKNNWTVVRLENNEIELNRLYAEYNIK